MQAIRERILAEMERRRLSMNGLAEGAGVPYSVVYHYLREGGSPAMSTVRKLLDYLGLDVRVVKRRG